MGMGGLPQKRLKYWELTSIMLGVEGKFLVDVDETEINKIWVKHYD